MTFYGKGNPIKLFNQKDSNKRNKYLTLLTSLYKLKRRVDKIILSIEKDKEKKIGKLTDTKR